MADHGETWTATIRQENRQDGEKPRYRFRKVGTCQWLLLDPIPDWFYDSDELAPPPPHSFYHETDLELIAPYDTSKDREFLVTHSTNIHWFGPYTHSIMAPDETEAARIVLRSHEFYTQDGNGLLDDWDLERLHKLVVDNFDGAVGELRIEPASS